MSQFKLVTPMLETTDLQRTVDFYVDVLGFDIETLVPDDEPNFCILDRDGVSISFFVDVARTEPQQFTGRLYIDVAGVPELYERVRNRANVRWGPEVFAYGRREFAIYDCNGYTLTFSERTSDPPTALAG